MASAQRSSCAAYSFRSYSGGEDEVATCCAQRYSGATRGTAAQYKKNLKITRGTKALPGSRISIQMAEGAPGAGCDPREAIKCWTSNASLRTRRL